MLKWFRKSLVRHTALVAGAASALITTSVGLATVFLALRDEPAALRGKIAVVATVAGALTVFAVVIAVAATLRKVFGEPLRSLAKTMKAAEEGDFLIRANTKREDELGDLARQFNQMLAKITDLEVESVDDRRELESTRRDLELKSELEARVRELSLMFEIAQAVSSPRSENEILREIAQKTSQTLNFEEFAILLVDQDESIARVRATYGFPEAEEIEGMEFRADEGISGSVIRSGQPCIIGDTSKDTRYLHYKGRHMADGSFLSVPMKYQDRVVGLFNVLRRDVDAFHADDIKLLSSVANTAALTLVNAQMGNRLRLLTRTDDSTGLATQAHFTERLATEIDRSRRFGTPCGLLRLATTSKKTAEQIEESIKNALRSLDVATQLSEQTYVVLLPATRKEDVKKVAAKLLRRIDSQTVSGETSATHIAIGVAGHPEDGTSASQLLAAVQSETAVDTVPLA